MYGTALNLIPDEQFLLLYPILLDNTMTPDVLDAILSDCLSREDELRVQVLKMIQWDQKHPLSDDAQRILDTTGDLGQKPAGYSQTVQTELR